jgi:hypothetical protein
MFDFDYVSKDEYMPEKEELISIVSDVQDEVREQFTFTYKFVGSSSRNMITCDYSTNIGYDFDVDIDVNDDEENYTAKEIKTILMNAFNKVNRTTKYGNCKDSTRVFTIKVVNFSESRIMHSCDFAVINDCSDGRRQYIHHNKPQRSYYWEYKHQGYYELPVKVKWCKDKNHWTEVRSRYIENKNNNGDKNKHSSAIYAETVNQVYNEYHD